MWINDLENEIIDLGTTFEESLKSDFYLINKNNSEWKKRISCFTKDWQYSFYFSLENWKIEILWNRKEIVEWYSLEKNIEQLQWLFSFEHNYEPIYNYKEFILQEKDLEDENKISSLLIEIEQKETSNDVNNTLFAKK